MCENSPGIPQQKFCIDTTQQIDRKQLLKIHSHCHLIDQNCLDEIKT